MNRKTIAALVAAPIAAALLTVTPAAQAAPFQDDDKAACIAWGEFHYAQRGTMHAEETAWEVTKLGHVVASQDHGRHIIKQYPRCGYRQTGPAPVGWVQVAYDRNKAGQYMASYISLWATGLRSDRTL
jgi:hypothetical protein